MIGPLLRWLRGLTPATTLPWVAARITVRVRAEGHRVAATAQGTGVRISPETHTVRTS